MSELRQSHVTGISALTLNYVILLIKNGSLCLMIVIRHGDMIEALEKQRRVGHCSANGRYIINRREREDTRSEGDKIWGRCWWWCLGGLVGRIHMEI
jgi:hypothetical protein